MKTKTFEFREGTVIASVSERTLFDPKAQTITQTGEFTACLIGGTAPGIKPKQLNNADKTPRVFSSYDDAFEAAHQLAVELGYHPE